MQEALIEIPAAVANVKRCRKCLTIKPASLFYRDITQPDGLQKYCIPCRRDQKGITKRDAERKAAREVNRLAAEAERIRRREARSASVALARERREDNKEEQASARKDRERARRKNNPEYFKEKAKRWADRNRDKIKVSARAYAAKQPAGWRREKDARYREGKADCPLFRLAKRIRTTTRNAFNRKKIKKNNLTIEMVGCSWEVLKQHIEKQFTKGMRWSNMHLWHIDHIVPLASAQTESELVALAHFSNLRPLWAAENMEKGDKIIACQPELLLCMR